MEGYVEKNISEELGGVSPYAVIQCKTGAGVDHGARCHMRPL